MRAPLCASTRAPRAEVPKEAGWTSYARAGAPLCASPRAPRAEVPKEAAAWTSYARAELSACVSRSDSPPGGPPSTCCGPRTLLGYGPAGANHVARSAAATTQLSLSGTSSTRMPVPCCGDAEFGVHRGGADATRRLSAGRLGAGGCGGGLTRAVCAVSRLVRAGPGGARALTAATHQRQASDQTANGPCSCHRQAGPGRHDMVCRTQPLVTQRARAHVREQARCGLGRGMRASPSLAARVGNWGPAQQAGCVGDVMGTRLAGCSARAKARARTSSRGAGSGGDSSSARVRRQRASGRVEGRAGVETLPRRPRARVGGEALGLPRPRRRLPAADGRARNAAARPGGRRRDARRERAEGGATWEQAASHAGRAGAANRRRAMARIGVGLAAKHPDAQARGAVHTSEGAGGRRGAAAARQGAPSGVPVQEAGSANAEAARPGLPTGRATWRDATQARMHLWMRLVSCACRVVVMPSTFVRVDSEASLSGFRTRRPQLARSARARHNTQAGTRPATRAIADGGT